jgi:hypothetical protein
MQNNTLHVTNDSNYEQNLKCPGTYVIEEKEAFRVVDQ